MNKLKTLKDFKRNQYSAGADKKGNLVKYFNEKSLRQEAIKWLKYHKEHWDDNVVNIVTNPKVEAFIFTFFNLTDEDLKWIN